MKGWIRKVWITGPARSGCRSGEMGRMGGVALLYTFLLFRCCYPCSRNTLTFSVHCVYMPGCLRCAKPNILCPSSTFTFHRTTKNNECRDYVIFSVRSGSSSPPNDQTSADAAVQRSKMNISIAFVVVAFDYKPFHTFRSWHRHSHHADNRRVRYSNATSPVQLDLARSERPR
jgi:hypothetical protein